jgi:hypothetical protein
LKVIADFKEFVDFEIKRLYNRVDGDRVKLKEQIMKCDKDLQLKAQDSRVLELAVTCQKLEKEMQGTVHKVYLQDEKLARLSYSKKLDDLEFQVEMLHKQVHEAVTGVHKMQEQQIYKESYAEVLSTKSALPSCLSCGSKPSTASPKLMAVSGLYGADRRFYKGDDSYNNLMLPGAKRLTLHEPLSFTEDSLESPDKRSQRSLAKKFYPHSDAIPVLAGRMRTTSESPTHLRPRPVRPSSDAARELVKRRKTSQSQRRTKDFPS